MQKLSSHNENHNFVTLAWLDQTFPEGQHTVRHFSYTADQFYYLSQIEFLLNRHGESPKVLGLWSRNNLASFKISSDSILAQNSFQTQHLGLDLEVD